MNAGAALTMYVMGATMVLAFVLAVVPLPTSLRRLPEFTGIAGIVATLAITVAQWGERQVAFYGELRIDRFGLLMTWIIMLSALATIALAWGEPAAAGRRPEFTGLVLAAATGMMLTVMSGDLITLFIGIELLSPVHELVRAAASQQEGVAPNSTIALRVTSESVPAGIYPIAIHAWTYLGARDDFEVVVTTLDPALNDRLGQLLVEASDARGADGPQPDAQIDDRHYEKWASSRATHIDRTRAHVETQLSSLSTTHHARVQLLEDQISKASHDNIRRMRESELRSLEDDFDTRTNRLTESIQRSDITATLLCSGIVEVVND